MVAEKIKRIATVTVLCLILCLGAFPTAVRGETKSFATQRVVLLENFDALWCYYCYDMMDEYNRLMGKYGPDKLAIIFYDITSTDEFYFAGAKTRAAYYGVTGVPWQMVDGLTQVGPYGDFDTPIDNRLAIEPKFQISISGDISTGSVNVHLEQTDTSSISNLKMRYVVLESNLTAKPYPPENPEGRNYSFIARTILSEDTVTTPVPSGGTDFPKTFTVKPEWVKKNLSFVAFIQRDTGKEVYQACHYGYNPITGVPEIPATLVIGLAGLFVTIFILVGYRQRQKKDERDLGKIV